MQEAAVPWVFKVADRTSWDRACGLGVFSGSADDVRDGFIHLSALHQLRGTLERHFNGQADLVLIKLAADRLGSALRWEASRGGELFPHLYAPLPTAAAVEVRPLRLDESGVPVVPGDI